MTDNESMTKFGYQDPRVVEIITLADVIRIDRPYPFACKMT